MLGGQAAFYPLEPGPDLGTPSPEPPLRLGPLFPQSIVPRSYRAERLLNRASALHTAICFWTLGVRAKLGMPLLAREVQRCWANLCAISF